MVKVNWVGGGQWKEILRRKLQVEAVNAALTNLQRILVKDSHSNDVLGGWWRMDA